MKRKLICLLLCLCTVCACIPGVSAYYNTAEWARPSVDSMYELGLLPDSLADADMTLNITRGEMCQMAVKLYTFLTDTPASPDSLDHFSDTTDPAICFAKEQGIIDGYPDGTFRPNNALTRQDFFKITYSLMGTAYWTAEGIELVSLDRFNDANAVSNYAKEATRVMVSIGVVQGDTNNRLQPKNNTTRQEAIVMFFRAFQYLNNWINEFTEENKAINILHQGYSGISDWAIHEVSEMQSKGMIPSCLDNCNMSNPITREQMCSIAVLAYEKATGAEVTPSGTNHFDDTTNPDVNAAYELGIVSGMGNGKFSPNSTLTREQFFKIMGNFMAAIGYPRTDAISVSLSQFSDGSKVASWAAAPARLLIYIGAVNGTGTSLNPKGDTTIQEAIAIFLRCFKYTTAWMEDHPDGEEVEEVPDLLSEIVAYAKRYEGYPYVYGGNGPNSFDCSGFVLYVYKHFGYSFSRGAQEQYHDGLHVSKSELLPGDLVFFTGGSYYITHVGLYIGDGYFIHAANPARGVVIDTLATGHYANCYYGACRIISD